MRLILSAKDGCTLTGNYERRLRLFTVRLLREEICFRTPFNKPTLGTRSEVLLTAPSAGGFWIVMQAAAAGRRDLLLLRVTINWLKQHLPRKVSEAKKLAFHANLWRSSTAYLDSKYITWRYIQFTTSLISRFSPACLRNKVHVTITPIKLCLLLLWLRRSNELCHFSGLLLSPSPLNRDEIQVSFLSETSDLRLSVQLAYLYPSINWTECWKQMLPNFRGIDISLIKQNASQNC